MEHPDPARPEVIYKSVMEIMSKSPIRYLVRLQRKLKLSETEKKLHIRKL